MCTIIIFPFSKECSHAIEENNWLIRLKINVKMLIDLRVLVILMGRGKKRIKESRQNETNIQK